MIQPEIQQEIHNNKRLTGLSLRLERIISIKTNEPENILNWLDEWLEIVFKVGRLTPATNPSFDLRRAGFYGNAYVHIVGGWENPDQYAKWVIGQVQDFLEYGELPPQKSVLMVQQALTLYKSKQVLTRR